MHRGSGSAEYHGARSKGFWRSGGVARCGQEYNPTLWLHLLKGAGVVVAFDGGKAVTTDAVRQLLGETDRTIRLTARFAACFADVRTPELVEHEVSTLVLQVIGAPLELSPAAGLGKPRRPRRAAARSGASGAGWQACSEALGLGAAGRQMRR